MGNRTHECQICGRVFDAEGEPVICNKCLNNAHTHRPRSDGREIKREATDMFYEAWEDYEREYE